MHSRFPDPAAPKLRTAKLLHFAAVVLVACLAVLAKAQCPLTLASPVSYAVGSQPRSVAVGDFNADGLLDLAVANNFGNNPGTVSVYLGTGTGTFGGRVDLTAGVGPIHVAAGDLDGDGRPELVVTNQFFSLLNVFRNTGTTNGGPVSFSAAYGLSSGGYFPHSVAILDLNGDDKPDLAVANEGGSWPDHANVSILRNTSTGPGSISFTAPTSYPAGILPGFVAAGDLNADGKPDLAVATGGSPGLSILLGAGDGTFGAATTFPVGDILFSAVIHDVNADGKPDVVGATQSRAAVLFNDGTGNFSTPGLYPVGNYPHHVAVSDLNGDGAPDLAAVNRASANISILLNSGTGTFGAASHYAVGVFPLYIGTGDFDQNGTTDLAVVNNYGWTVSVLLNGSPCQINHPPVANAGADQAADEGTLVALEGTGSSDPDNDPLTYSWTQTAGAGVVLSDATSPSPAFTAPLGGGTLTFRLVVNDGLTDSAPDTVNINVQTQCPVALDPPVNYAVGASPRSVAVDDFNADGLLDLAVANNFGNNPGTVSIHLGTGTGTFGGRVDLTAGVGPIHVVSGDLDGDGRPEVVVTHTFASLLNVFRNTSTTNGGPVSFSAAYGLSSGGYFPQSVTVCNLDGDDQLDLVMSNEGGSWPDQANVAVLLNTSTGPGSISFTGPVAYPAGIRPTFVAAGDLNADGRADLAVATGGSAGLSVLLGAGDGTFGAATTFPVGDILFSTVIHDVNADGKPDVVGATQSRAAVLFNDGAGDFSAPGLYPVGNYPHYVAVRDLNGDGAPDLAVANRLSANISILLNSGTGTFGTASHFAVGTLPLYIDTGDFDRNGTVDLAVVNHNSSTVSVLLNSSPCQVDTDADGLGDDLEIVHGTDPNDPDTDNDSLLDGTEVDMAMGGGCPSPLDTDSDNDTLTDGAEVTLGTMPCNSDTDADLVPDNIDPEPTVPGDTGGVIEIILRSKAAWVDGLPLPDFDAPNDNARKGRRNALSNKLNAAANAIAAGNIAGAMVELESLLQKVDGDPSPPDWMLAGSDKNELRTAVEAIIAILELL